MFSTQTTFRPAHRTLAASALLLAGIAATIAAGSALGADAPAPGATASSADSARCGHRGEMNLAKMNERAAKMFASVDSNGDGKITEAEFLAAKPPHGGAGHRPGMGGPPMGGPHMGMEMAGTGHRHGAVDQQQREARMEAFQNDLFKALDADHNGQLSQAEFSKAWATAQTMMKKAAFAKLDKNGDGVLTKDEFPPYLAKLSAMDSNGDGTVSRDEMKAAHAAKTDRSQTDPMPH